MYFGNEVIIVFMLHVQHKQTNDIHTAFFKNSNCSMLSKHNQVVLPHYPSLSHTHKLNKKVWRERDGHGLFTTLTSPLRGPQQDTQQKGLFIGPLAPQSNPIVMQACVTDSCWFTPIYKLIKVQRKSTNLFSLWGLVHVVWVRWCCKSKRRNKPRGNNKLCLHPQYHLMSLPVSLLITKTIILITQVMPRPHHPDENKTTNKELSHHVCL